jgi:DNA-binding transcriptional MerR regulator
VLVHQLATRSGLSPHTVRHYVRIGLLKPSRSASGYATFGEDALVVAELIGIGKTLGFSLSEIKRQLKPFHAGAMRFEEIRDVLIEKEVEVSRRIEELTVVRARLRSMVANCPLQNNLAASSGLKNSPSEKKSGFNSDVQEQPRA